MKRYTMRTIAILLVVQMILSAAPDLFSQGTNLIGKLVSNAIAEVLPQGELPEAWSIGESELGETMSSGDWNYAFRADDGYAVITGYTGDPISSVAVPVQLGGTDVVGLASASLSFDGVKDVYLDGNVTWIAEDAFGKNKPTIHALSGTYGLYFASVNGYEYVNESDGTFVEGVIDYTDVETDRISIESENQVVMNSLEAEQLQTGSIFYMEDSKGLPSIFEVTEISAVSETETMLSVASPELSESVIDFERNGSFDVNIADLDINENIAKPNKENDKIEFYLDFEDKNFRLKVELGYEGKFTYDTLVLGSEVIQGTMTGKHKYSVDVSLETKIAGGWFEKDEFETLTPDEFFSKFLLKASEDYADPGSVDINIKSEKKMAIYKEKSIATYTMPANFFHLKMDIGSGFSIKGALSGHWEESFEQEYVYDYYSQSWKTSKGTLRRNENKNTSLQGSVEGSVYAKVSISVGIVGVVDVVAAGLEAGFQLSISAEITLSGTPSDEAYCLEMYFTPYAKAFLEIGVWGKIAGIGIGGKIWRASGTFDLEDLGLGLKDLATIHYNTKLGFHSKANCVFANRLTVSFDTRCDQVIADTLVFPNLTVEHKPEYDLADNETCGTFLGWADSPNVAEPNWVFGTGGNIVTKDITLYAVWENMLEVQFESKTGQPLAPQFVPYGGYLVEPKVLVPEGLKLFCWTTKNNEGKTVIWDFGKDTVTAAGLVLMVEWREEASGSSSKPLEGLLGFGVADDVYVSDYSDKQTGSDYFEYSFVKDGDTIKGLKITGVKNNPVNLVIPETLTIPEKATNENGETITVYNTYDVLSLGSAAFKGSTTLKSIIFEAEALNLNIASLFSGCTSLEYVNLKNSGLTSIPDYAFTGCTSLRYIDFPDTIKNIGDYAFNNCKQLRCLYLPEGIESIGTLAFKYCSSLEELYIPDSVKEIKVNGSFFGPFMHCASLKKISIGGVETITSGMLRTGSQVLEELIIRGTVKEIGSGAFASNGATYNIDSGVSNYNGYNKNSCGARLIIEEGVEKIGANAFNNCDAFTEIYLPDSLTSIESAAFANSNCISVLRVGTNTTSIASNSFDGCSKFTACVESGNDVAYNYFKNKGHTLGQLGEDGSIRINIIYDANGGVFINEAVSTTVEQAWNDEILLPEPPSNGDNIFCGWYTDAACTKKWNSETVPSKDIILYAGWNINCYDLTLNANGGTVVVGDAAGSSVTFKAQAGTNLIVGIAAQMDGMVFTGWFTDEDCMKPFSGSMPAKDTVLYAGWAKNSANADYIFANGEATLVNYDRIEYEGTSLYLPAEVNGMPLTTIAAGALDGTDFTTVYIPETVNNLEEGALSGMESLERIIVHVENLSYKSVDGVLFSKDGSELILYPANKGISYRIPEGVCTIGAHAFADSIVRSVMLNNDLRYIGDYAFANTGIATARFPEGLVEIGDYAYTESGISSPEFPASLTTIGKGAFSGCKNISRIQADSTLTSIGDGAFSFCASTLAIYGPVEDCAIRRYAEENNCDYNYYLLNLHYPDGGKRSYVYQAGNIFNLPTDVKMEENAEFSGWYTDELCSATWVAGAPMPRADLELYAGTTAVFAYETVSTVVGSETDDAGNVTEITQDSLCLTEYHSENSDAVIPESIGGVIVTHLKAGCFGEYVTSVTIPSSVISIETGAIPVGATIITVPGSVAEEYAQNNGFSGGYISYTLKWETNGGAEMESENITGGSTVVLKTPVRSGCSFVGWYIDDGLSVPVESTIAGEIIMPYGDLTLYAAWEIIDESAANLGFTYEQSSGTITITGLADGVTELVIPDTLHGLPVTDIDNGAFRYEDALTSVSIPGSISIIPENAFRNCSELASVELAEGIVQIGEDAFYGCSQLIEIALPASVTSVEAEAFRYCGISSITLGTNLSEFDVSALDDCNQLSEILVADGNGRYISDDGVLYDVQYGQLVKYPPSRIAESYCVREDASEIGAYAFRDASVGQVVLHAEIAAIGTGAFADSGLENVPDLSGCSISSIPDECFSGCTSLTEVVLPNGILSIGKNAFAYCSGIESASIPQTVESIASRAFVGASPVIYSRTGSAAESYAVDNGLLFVDPDCTVLPESIAITEEQIDLKRGDMHQLSVVTMPGNATNTDVRWFALDEEIVSISGNGLMRALSGGKTKVYAYTENDCVAECIVNVDPTVEVETVILSDSEATISTDDILQLNAICLPDYATYHTVEWSSSDENVAVVDANGLVTPMLPGTAVITAEAHNGITAECSVTVFAYVNQLVIGNVADGACYNIGDTQQLDIQVLPEYARDQTITYSSSDSSIATVDENGIVSFADYGYVIITAVAADRGNVSASIELECLPEFTFTLPTALTIIEEEAFNGMPVQCVVMAEGVEVIKSKAFAECKDLYKVVLPGSVTEIADDAFEGSNCVTICASEGSYAQIYADEHDISFRTEDK